jgi:hypothetical protein
MSANHNTKLYETVTADILADLRNGAAKASQAAGYLKAQAESDERIAA